MKTTGRVRETAGYYSTSLTKAQRDRLVKEFRSSDTLNTLVLSDAGATGLNLSIECGNTLDLPDQYYYKWNREWQRNWRGLKTDTTYQYLFQTTRLTIVG